VITEVIFSPVLQAHWGVTVNKFFGFR